MNTQNRIQVIYEPIYSSSDNLYLAIELLIGGVSQSLSLATFMQYLYANEDNIHKDDSEFCFVLMKLIKKVDISGTFYFAIPTDDDQALFFKKVIEHSITLSIKTKDTITPIQQSTTLPLTITVSQKGAGIQCTLKERSSWLEDPKFCQMFQWNQEVLYLVQEESLIQVSQSLDSFLDSFLDTDVISYPSASEVSHFIQTIYTPNKAKLIWQINTDFDSLIPKETPPVPYLKLTYDNNTLSPTLFFQYETELITPGLEDTQVINKSTGKTMIRMKDMEAIYQQDLMTLFTETGLPFMLQSPADIAQFLDKIVPNLEERNWIVESDVPEFNIQKEPVKLQFSVNSSGTDWFHFEPSCNVNGQKMSLQEIASLMVKNQGYLKTKKGYVKLEASSQKELEALAEMGAFRIGAKFSKADILPMISASEVTGATSEARELIDNLNGLAVGHTSVSDDFIGDLRPYQQYGVNWMYFLAQAGLGGVLADDMGLGKTCQTIALSTILEGDAPILVVGPTNVIYNWQREIEKFAPSKNVLVHAGVGRNAQLNGLFNPDFIITSFGVLKNDLDLFKDKKFKAIFVDEAQYMKNPQSQISKALKTLKASYKLAMTGTPIENKFQDLWNLFDFVMPGYLGKQSEFDSKVKTNQTKQLKMKIKPFILRREKREVLDSLPEKTEIILKCPLNDTQAQLYQTVLDAAKKGIKAMDGKRDKLNILAALLKLRQVCIHPGLLKEFKDQDYPSSKMEILKEKLLEVTDEGHKVVVFSQFTGMLDFIQNWLEQEHINFTRIDGSVTGKQRMTVIDKFETMEGSCVMLVSLKAGGVGINLTSADYVFHTDPWWNPAVEAQATDRVHRMGQKNKVFVYKLIAEGTIEEKIQELQASKKQLLEKVVDIDSAVEKSVDIEEVKELVFG